MHTGLDVMDEIEVERWATPQEASQAIELLTPTELMRLSSFARYRMRALGVKACGRTYEDLMGEAVTSTLAGNRRWNKRAVDLVGHLSGVMRSVSSHWREHSGLDEVAWPETGRGTGVPLDLPHRGADQERTLLAIEEVAQIRDRFADDTHVTKVLDAFADGLTGPDIKAKLRLSQTAFETIMKRLRRGVARMNGPARGTRRNGEEIRDGRA